MGSLNTPNKGQPIDYSYIKQIVDAVNRLEDAKSSDSNILDKATNTQNKVSTNNVVIVTRYVEVSFSEKATSSRIEFGSSFKTTPIVTATIVSTNDGNDPEKTTLALQNVTSTGCEVLLYSIEKKQKKVGINIIAIGEGLSRSV